jgi:hypothetical protein
MLAYPDAMPAPGQPTSPQEAADTAVRIRRAGWVLAIGAAVLIPWTAYLAWELPERSVAVNYDLAWGGFDVGLIILLAMGAWAAFRANRWLPALAAATATMLVIDAWFDVVTSRGDELVTAVLMAVLVELPVAIACLRLSVHTQGLVLWRAARHGCLGHRH